MKTDFFASTVLVALLTIGCEDNPAASDPPIIPSTSESIFSQELTITDDVGTETTVFQSGSNIHARLCIENACADTVLLWRVWDQSGLIPTCDVALVDFQGQA